MNKRKTKQECLTIGGTIMPSGVIDQGEAALKAILGEVDVGKIQLYLSVLQLPHVLFDLEGRASGCFLLFDPAVKHWLADYAWKKGIGLLRAQELERILNVLAGQAMATPIGKSDDRTLLNIIESEPVVAVLLDFMHTKTATRLEYGMTQLWKDLVKFAKKRGLLRLGRRRFPSGANVFSRVLKQFIPVLASLNLKVEIQRSNGSKVTISRLDDSMRLPSTAQSDSSASEASKLTPEDARAQRLKNLKERQSLKLPRPNSGVQTP